MKYFLDFDRTVFDTDTFKNAIARRPTVLELLRQLPQALEGFFAQKRGKTRRRHFLATFGAFMSHGRLMFTPEELREFIYPDVPEFLKTHDCTIVTYGVRAFITAKVATALTDLPLTDIVYTSRRKGRTIKKLCAKAEDQCVFVDDMIFQLVSVSAWCPEVEVIEIRRNGGKRDGRWRTIHSLDELEGV